MTTNTTDRLHEISETLRAALSYLEDDSRSPRRRAAVMAAIAEALEHIERLAADDKP